MDAGGYLRVVVTLGSCVGRTTPPRMSTGIWSEGADNTTCVPFESLPSPVYQSYHLPLGRYVWTVVLYSSRTGTIRRQHPQRKDSSREWVLLSSQNLKENQQNLNVVWIIPLQSCWQTVWMKIRPWLAKNPSTEYVFYFTYMYYVYICICTMCMYFLYYI